MTTPLSVIADLVPHGSRVLDLGCGDGRMLAHLRDTRGCSGLGVEINPEKLIAAAEKGVDVLQFDLEQGLSIFGDGSFDVVLQIDTLPNLRHTENALRETARVGRLGILSFANFRPLEHSPADPDGPPAGDARTALRVVQHAESARGDLCRLRASGCALRPARSRRLRHPQRPPHHLRSRAAGNGSGVLCAGRVTA
jgi:Methylase involved in ubiquinone/menaquinone biosynthesis